MLKSLQLALVACSIALEIDAFVVRTTQHHLVNQRRHEQKLFMASEKSWTSILEGFDDNSPVQKSVIEEGDGEIPARGSTVEIEYVGVIGKSQIAWGVDDVIEGWLKNLQGLYDVLEGPFRENNIDGEVIFDDEKFTEAFLSEDLGIANKIQCKKTIMAAKRLRVGSDEYPEGTEFDSSFERNKNYEFVLGNGKAIKAMDLLVSTMSVGEKAKVICRSDYGYGSEGYRKANGDVVVPPFATLCFTVTLVSSSSA